MARCKLTRMSLRNIRKDKQYQCIVIDFVRTGVISKSKAEELLNYSIPAGLLENSAYVPDDDDEPGNEYSGNESGNEYSGNESGNEYSGNESGNEYSGNESGNEYSGNGTTTPEVNTKFTVVWNGYDDHSAGWGEMELDMSDLGEAWENNALLGDINTNAANVFNHVYDAVCRTGFADLGSANGRLYDSEYAPNAIRIVQLNPNAVLDNGYYTERKYIATSDTQINPGDIVEIYRESGSSGNEYSGNNDYSGNNNYSGC